MGKGRVVDLVSFFSQPENSTRHPRRMFGSFSIESICILSQSLSSCLALFVSNPRFVHLHFLQFFLKFLHFMYFSGFYGCFRTLQRLLHFIITSYWPNVLFVGQNALSCGSNKQTGLASDDQNTLTVGRED